MKSEDGWYYLFKGKKLRIAWCSFRYWINDGAYKHTWFYSFRNRMGYAKTTGKFGYWYQVCILGINFGYLYKTV